MYTFGDCIEKENGSGLARIHNSAHSTNICYGHIEHIRFMRNMNEVRLPNGQWCAAEYGDRGNRASCVRFHAANYTFDFSQFSGVSESLCFFTLTIQFPI